MTAVLATCCVQLTCGGDTISINFTRNSNVTTEHKGELGGIAASGWTNITAGNTSGTTVNNQSGVAAGVISISNVQGSWNSKIDAGTTVTSVVQRGYIDVPSQPENDNVKVYTISLDHDFWLSDVTLYMSADSANTKYASMNVNGTSYMGGETVTTGSGTWGTTGNPAGVTEYNTDNCFTVTGVLGSLVIKNDYLDGGNRATLAGLQVKDVSDTTGYFTTLGEGETSAASATWTINGASATYGSIADAQKNLGIRANEKGSTLLLTGGETVNSIAAVENTVTVKADSAINLSTGLYVYEGAEMVLDAALTGTNNVASGKGSITINSSSTFNSITTANLTIGGNVLVDGSFGVTGAVAVNEGATLTLKQIDAGETILKATGKGTIETYATTVINGTQLRDAASATPAVSTFTGKIVVKGNTLVIGNNGQWNGHWGADLSNLASIDLDGGNMKLFGSNSDISVINVKKNAQMNIWEATAVNGKGFAIEEINLEANLTSHATWDSNLSIGKLNGSGDITFTKDRGYNVTIGSIESCGKITNGVTMTIGTDASSKINISNTIVNNASLTVNGSISISENLQGFTMIKEGEIGGLSVNGTDGYQITNGSTYLLIDNNSQERVTITPTTANNGAINLTQDETTGDVTFVGGESLDSIYRVNTQDVTVGGVNATDNTGMATGFIVATGRTVTIAGASDAATAEALLVTTTGDGNITLATSVTLGSGDETKATGTLTIAQDTTITMGSGQETTPKLSSFSSMVFDGGSVLFNCKNDDWTNVVVSTKGGSIHLEDMDTNETDGLNFLGTTTLNGELDITTTWGAQVNITKVTGSGNIHIGEGGRNEVLTLTIDSVEDYSGKVHVTNKAHVAFNVAKDAGVHIHLDGARNGELNLTGVQTGNNVTLQGVAAYLTKDSAVNADLEILNSTDGYYAGLELNDGYSDSTNTFAGTITGGGNMVINKQDITNVTQKFTGDISGWTGNIDIAGGTDHRVLFTGDATTINNGKIISRKAGDRTVNTGATVTFNHEKAVTVNSELQQQANSTFNVVVKNSSEAGTTFTKSVSVNKITVTEGTNANFNGVVSVSVLEALGNVSLTAQDVLNVTDLTVGQAGELTIVGSIDASGAVTLAGGATINAAVVDLSDASSVSFDVASGAITLNGALTMSGTEAFVTALGNSLAGLTAGEMLTVFTGLESFTIGNVTSADFTSADLSTWSNSDAVAAGQYTVEYQVNNNVGSIVIINRMDAVPEPASATLSLAALMMLCARRRRRK